MSSVLWLDYESKSECDLPSKGAYNYCMHPSTKMLCAAYAFDDEEVQLWWAHEPVPARLAEYFKSGGQIRAHNSAFDRLLTWYVVCGDYGLPEPALERWYCTAAQARANCAPGSLEDVGRFASSDMRKDHRGKQLIRKCCLPPFSQDPALLAELGEYAMQDVRTMRAVSLAMRDLSDVELADYHVNERINDRGVLVDRDLCDAAVRYAEAELLEIQNLVAELTEGEITSVRSPKMREWVLARVGGKAKKLMTVYKDDEKKYSIDKTIRANLLALAEEDHEEIPPVVADVIQCADDLWASSVAKFSRLSGLADDEDHRVRGAFVFAGGSATGRASSYGAQVHNFTRKCAADPVAVRQAMVRGHQIVPKYGKRVTDVLKGMLRPALIPAPGNVLVVADWSAIEGRVHPWLVNTPEGEAKLDVFRSQLDPYKVNASATFRVAYDDVTAEQRQVGKVQELACFAAETKVLTHRGVKAIVDVELTDLLWDGEEWVRHGGLIYRGRRQTINVCGMEVTPDHLIKTRQTWTQAKTLVSNKQLLTHVLEVGSENLPSWETNGSNKAQRGCGTSKSNVLAVLSRIWSTFTIYLKVRRLVATRVLKNQQGIGAKTITSTRKRAQTTRIAGVCLTDYRPAKIDATTQMIEGTQITAGGASVCMSHGEKIKPLFFSTLLRLKDGINRIWNLIASTSTKITNLATLGLLLGKSTGSTKEKSKTCKSTFLNSKPVFDILNSGLRNRFTVVTDAGCMIVHNCGFLGGAGAFSVFGRAYGIHFSEAEAKRAVDGWRRANPWAVDHGQKLENAYTRAVRNPSYEFSAGRVTYLFDGQHLWYALPSGRILCYPYAKLETDGLSYAKAAFKPAADAAEWPRSRLWRGLACENITQATANDILRYALRELDARGLGVVLHVHDEIVVECAREAADAVVAAMTDVMCTAPDWAQGLPLAIEIKVMDRYGK